MRIKLIVPILFSMILCISCDNKMQIDLPNGFLWQGDKSGNSHLSTIVDASSGNHIDNVLDIFVFKWYVYGCFDFAHSGNDKYFVIDTKNRAINLFGDSELYSKFLKENGLPNGYVTGSINILEVRKSSKNIYW